MRFLILAEELDCFSRAKRYAILKYAFWSSEIIFILIALLVFQGSGFAIALARLVFEAAPFYFGALAAYVSILFAGYYFLIFPSRFYLSYVLEHQFALSTQTLNDWLKDEVKSCALSYILYLVVILVFYWILGAFAQSWWWIAGLFWIFFNLVLARLVPVVIIPLFFKYRPLSDQGLRGRIMNLALRMEIKLLDCYEIDLSRKTLKANAAFTGWGKTRRVILADTLKDKYSYDEIEVIMAHEFAHYKHKHLLQMLALNCALTLILLYIIFRTSEAFLHNFGLQSLSDIAAFPLLGVYVVIFGVATQPLTNWILRVFERQADAMAISATSKKDAFISMLEKLSLQNLSDRNPHPLIKWFFFDHPSVDERIALARKF